MFRAPGSSKPRPRRKSAAGSRPSRPRRPRCVRRSRPSQRRRRRRLQQTTYGRLKAVQDRDSGLIAAQQVDRPAPGWRQVESEVETARSRVEAVRQTPPRWSSSWRLHAGAAGAAASKVDATRSHVQAARGDLQASRQGVEAARRQVKVAEDAQRDTVKRQIGGAQAGQRALGAQVRVADAQIAGFAAAERRQPQRDASRLGSGWLHPRHGPLRRRGHGAPGGPRCPGAKRRWKPGGRPRRCEGGQRRTCA